MSDTKHAVLIHGMFQRGEYWAPVRSAFENRGYTVHTPTLAPRPENAMAAPTPDEAPVMSTRLPAVEIATAAVCNETEFPVVKPVT